MSGQITMIVQEISRLDFGRLAKERNRKYKIQKILDDHLHGLSFYIYATNFLPGTINSLTYGYFRFDSHKYGGYKELIGGYKISLTSNKILVDLLARWASSDLFPPWA